MVEEIGAKGIVMFKYIDCVNREATVRRRIKLHLKVAFQPHVREGAAPVFSGTIDKMVSLALELDDGDSVQFPLSHGGEELIVIEFKR